MDVTRRRILAGVGGLAASTALSGRRAAGAFLPAQQAPALTAASGFPWKADFAIPDGTTYINGAYVHPISRASLENMRLYAQSRLLPDGDVKYDRINIKAEFAALINAKPAEIAFVGNTTSGENLVTNGLELLKSGGNVVTDAYQFEGALIHLQELQRQGLDLRIVMPRDRRIQLQDLERVIDKKTKLVSISLVGMFTGFQHDLKAVCDLAHANGAVVYADIAQAAGATPIDVKASGVDFCACSSFKWLMGDFGLGFVYAREDLLGPILKRPWVGYYQTVDMASHFLPFDPPGDVALSYELGKDATSYFEVGSQASGAWAALSKSLPYIRQLGVENIEAHRQPLLQRLRQEMPRLGFVPMTPDDSKAAPISFGIKDVMPYVDRLKKANINVRLSRHFIRVSPSVYNDMADIERFLDAIS
jgi:selenocysteine lyase/cysteine desulfurase